MAADGSPQPLLAEGAQALGPSFVESYGVWLNLCGRATIGNFAFDEGHAATPQCAVATANLLAEEELAAFEGAELMANEELLPESVESM